MTAAPSAAAGAAASGSIAPARGGPAGPSSIYKSDLFWNLEFFIGIFISVPK